MITEDKSVRIVYSPTTSGRDIRIVPLDTHISDYSRVGKCYRPKAMLDVLPRLMEEGYEIVVDNSAENEIIEYSVKLNGNNGSNGKKVLTVIDGDKKEIKVIREKITIGQLVDLLSN